MSHHNAARLPRSHPARLRGIRLLGTTHLATLACKLPDSSDSPSHMPSQGATGMNHVPCRPQYTRTSYLVLEHLQPPRLSNVVLAGFLCFALFLLIPSSVTHGRCPRERPKDTHTPSCMNGGGITAEIHGRLRFRLPHTRQLVSTCLDGRTPKHATELLSRRVSLHAGRFKGRPFCSGEGSTHINKHDDKP